MLAPQLARFTIFSSIGPEDLLPLAPHLKERRYRRGQILFVEGELGSNVFFVISGLVKLSNNTPDGEEQILDWCGPYDSFAEILLLETGSYPATAEVVQESTVLVLDNGAMSTIVENHPKLALALIRTLSKKLRMSQEFIRILTTRSTTGILAALLLRLARPACTPSQPIYVDATLTNRDLANMIGT
ncbi:MAG: Crp/Fnr family transcriptional regulator, partial [Desulfitobacteriaceae bacterium]